MNKVPRGRVVSLCMGLQRVKITSLNQVYDYVSENTWILIKLQYYLLVNSAIFPAWDGNINERNFSRRCMSMKAANHSTANYSAD